MKFALTKLLPFILTLCAGLALGNFPTRTGFHEAQTASPETRRNIQHSRTWLVIHYQPHPSFPEAAAEMNGEPCSVSLRVRFDADGTISKALPENIYAPEACVAAAVEAARRIAFTPASEDGAPVSVWATVSYGFNEMIARVSDEKGRPYCVTSRRPFSSPVEIVSVEGAAETEGWRVVYE
jgi:hypothetical protein